MLDAKSWIAVWPMLLVAFGLFVGCATSSDSSTRIEPDPTDEQMISYQRGRPQIKTRGSNPVRLTLVDHAADQMIVHLSVRNRGKTEYLFSHQDVSGEMITRNGALPMTVYSYEEVLQELDDRNETLAKEAGSKAVSVGSRAVPYGDTAESIADLVMLANAQQETDSGTRLDRRTKAALDDAYIRPNTMTKGSRYEGMLRIALPAPLSECESLEFDVQAGPAQHHFAFDCLSGER